MLEERRGRELQEGIDVIVVQESFTMPLVLIFIMEITCTILIALGCIRLTLNK